MARNMLKSNLTVAVLERIEARAAEIGVDAMINLLGEVGSDTKLDTGSRIVVTLLAQQNALLEELVTDVKKVLARLETGTS